MSKNEKKWPDDCIWPAPIEEGGGTYWDADSVPMELDEDTQELVDIKYYYDELVHDEILDEEYRLIDDEFGEPEVGEEYWDGEAFLIDAWEDDLTDALNRIKIDPLNGFKDPVSGICATIGYQFINENLLRQAFTRRTFQTEYKLSGCSEELEFIGDSILSSVVTKELVKHFTEIDSSDTEAPFMSKYDEGELSRLRSHFICKEYLGKRCEKLGLDKYILCGTGDECNLSAKEDTVEALIAAVAIDCNWDKEEIEDVVDRIVDIQIDQPDRYLKKSYYELLNTWHLHFFHEIPEYTAYRNGNKNRGNTEWYNCILRFEIPENDKDIWTSQIAQGEGETRSIAREDAARKAYQFIVENGLWLNLRYAEVVPKYEDAINQLQELYQKKYIEKPEYDFSRERTRWYCSCRANGVIAECGGNDKTEAKKKASYEVLIKLLMAAGCCKDEWYKEMVRIVFG